MMKFLKSPSKKNTLPSDELEPKSGSPISKAQVCLQDCHAKTESTEEESLSESKSKSFDTFWETDSGGSTDSGTDSDSNSDSDSDSDSDCPSKVLSPKGRERTRYQLHAKENQEEEKIMKDTHNEACRYLRVS